MPALTCILLVDDDRTTNYLNQLLLTQMGVAERVLVAEDGAQALQLLAQLSEDPAAAAGPQLILLDMNMPVLNGLGFLEAYDQLPPARQSAVVIAMLTVSLHPRDLARAQQLPVAGFASKPLTREKVTELLQHHFAQ